MGSRHATRMVALQALYALEMNPEATPLEVIGAVAAESEEAAVEQDFLARLVTGVWQDVASLDRVVERASRHWKLHRMDRVDKSILRLAIYELLRSPETPAAVILDEGVELAKDFGTPESPAFVNGILDRIARETRPEEFQAGA